MPDVPQRQVLDCPNFTFQGYFGRSQEIMQAYPYGGFAQFITAPASALVKLPDNVTSRRPRGSDISALPMRP